MTQFFAKSNLIFFSSQISKLIGGGGGGEFNPTFWTPFIKKLKKTKIKKIMIWKKIVNDLERNVLIFESLYSLYCMIKQQLCSVDN